MVDSIQCIIKLAVDDGANSLIKQFIQKTTNTIAVCFEHFLSKSQTALYFVPGLCFRSEHETAAKLFN